MTQDLDARIEQLRSKRSGARQKTEAELAEMQRRLECQVAAFRNDVSSEARAIREVMQTTGRRVRLAEERQAKLEETLANMEVHSRKCFRRYMRWGVGVIVCIGILSWGAMAALFGF